MIELGGTLEQFTCSRAGCREAALWRIEWRNPRIHEEGRTKTWLACDEHRGFLEDFLSARDFPLTVSALDAAAVPTPQVPIPHRDESAR
ncbi:hypothetical protein [Compostimonas suwonensis]|uniref:Acetone carboxylase n=1 Tax=Compostimonas suwonensis TaxID=1048394 RepID=A0A2M9BYN7_9MICO|nr:hypothetical protein [Compostimonas suwonensis]PJJ63201.1 hypothetical protein CLV54_0858 [Compostimonas suwonensis]